MPNDELGNVNTTSSYKERYSSMKDKLKHILYENELYHDELIRLKRELIDIYSDKDILLSRIIESGVDLGTSDDDENDEISQFSDIIMPASTSKCNNINDNQTDSDATSRIITLTADPNVTTISTTMTTAGMPTIVMNGPAKTSAPATQTTTTSETGAGSLEANTTTTSAAPTNGRGKPKGPAAPRSRAKPAAAANSKATTTKAATNKAPATGKPAPTKATSTKAIKHEAESASTGEDGAPVMTTNSDNPTAGIEDGSGAAKPKPKRKRPAAPKRTAAEKKAESEQQQQQQPDNQSSQQQSPIVTSEEVPGKPAKPPAPKRVRKPAVKKPKLTPQAAIPQDMQHSPMTVMGQVQLPVSLPNEQIKFVQHVNLPEQNLIGNNGNIILTNHAVNQIQVQQLHHFQQHNNQSHHRPQDNNNDNNNHQQIQIQLPQTTTSTMESFQTPQSIITTSQGGQQQQQLSGFGQHQSYTIVATNGNLIQHDLNHNLSPQPTTVQLTTAQSMSLNQAINQQSNGIISSQSLRGSNIQTHQGMTTQQETLQTINFQPLQHQSNGQQQQTQSQQQDDGNNYGSHQIIQFELPRQIQLTQVSQHQQQIHHQLQQMQPQQQQQMQPQQQQQMQPQQQQHMQMQQQQMTPVRSSSAQVAGNEDLEQQRRIEQQAAALLMNDWESSVASELFGSDSIKFMAED